MRRRRLPQRLAVVPLHRAVSKARAGRQNEFVLGITVPDAVIGYRFVVVVFPHRFAIAVVLLFLHIFPLVRGGRSVGVATAEIVKVAQL